MAKVANLNAPSSVKAITITLERVMALNAAYIRCIDTGALEQWPDFFLDRCLYKVTTAENDRLGFEAGIIYADAQNMLRDRISALRECNIYERHFYRHIVGLPTILRQDGDGAECETPFLVLRIMHDGESSVFASGIYRDVIRTEGDGLKFSQRLAICDSSRIDTLMALPL